MGKKASMNTIIQKAKTFADEVLRPRAGEFDREERLPREIIDEMAQRGYLVASLPEAYGGLGIDPVCYGYLTEEIGKACCSTRSLMTVQSSLVGETLVRWGTEEQKTRWLPQVSRGEMLGAFALSEPEIGSDARGVKTIYRQDGKKYILNGRKRWISFAEIAGFYIVIASCESKITAFIVERDRPGVTVYPTKGMLANRAAHLAEIQFADVRIPAENVIGKPGSGFTFVVNNALDHGRYSIAWAGVAIAQESLDCMATYARNRKQFGRKIGEHQLVQIMISNAVAKAHAARAICIKAGEMRSQGKSQAGSETAIAKYFASIIANEIASDAVQTFGGKGCSNRYPVERLFREAKLLEIIEGTSQIMQQIIAKYGLRNYGRTTKGKRE